jgi:hypothetical protein
MVDQFDPTRERKPKDFIEWDAADRIEQLETAFKKITGGGVDSVEVWTIAKTALENKDE